MWELRAAASLPRLCRDQGRRAEARDLLTPVYGWFTEGFDTPDLKEWKALLDELTCARRHVHQSSPDDPSWATRVSWSGGECLLRVEPASSVTAERTPVSALCSRWLTTRRMGEDAPIAVAAERKRVSAYFWHARSSCIREASCSNQA